ncbi:hypothetical protein CUMW_200540 [Citrus unshiu]|uniref:RRM domain-containing protein n=1 Tax=Citrus unshiu TaxID=55188 RepID=A0A2H5Q6K9_CITUN|nr:hypothetical protein CUMW_200540 [Citrus unshiu]
MEFDESWRKRWEEQGSEARTTIRRRKKKAKREGEERAEYRKREDSEEEEEDGEVEGAEEVRGETRHEENGRAAPGGDRDRDGTGPGRERETERDRERSGERREKEKERGGREETGRKRGREKGMGRGGAAAGLGGAAASPGGVAVGPEGRGRVNGNGNWNWNWNRERERELKERERDLEMRESRRYKEKKEVVEPEADPERDQRTVFAYQMPLKATERDVYEFFSKAGKVRDVRLIMDRNSRRSKGVGNAIMMRDDGNTLHSCLINSCCVIKFFLMAEVGMVFFLLGDETYTVLDPATVLVSYRYIEFYDVMSVPMAIALSGQLLLGQPVMVKPSEAEKNLVQSNTSAGGTATGPYGAIDRKLYVGNLHFNMTETQLRKLFEPFGPVELVQLPLDTETGQCKGFGFVQFAQLEHAKAAQSALNGKLEIVGRTLKVSSVTDHVGTQDTAAKSADFDDDDGGGLALNAQSRALLMQKLDRTGIATSIAGSLGVAPAVNGSAVNQQAISLPVVGQPAVPVPAVTAPVIPNMAAEFIGSPSECLLLKNMFDPAMETDPDFDLEIQGDVEEECSKYGRVKHIHVDKRSAGFVYLRFESTEAAASAQRAMHMRWFARRLISAIFMKPEDYEAKFKS